MFGWPDQNQLVYQSIEYPCISLQLKDTNPETITSNCLQ